MRCIPIHTKLTIITGSLHLHQPLNMMTEIPPSSTTNGMPTDPLIRYSQNGTMPLGSDGFSSLEASAAGRFSSSLFVSAADCSVCCLALLSSGFLNFRTAATVWAVATSSCVPMVGTTPIANNIRDGAVTKCHS